MSRIFYVAEPDPVVQLDLIGALKAHFSSDTIIVDQDLSKVFKARHHAGVCLLINGSLATGENAQALRQLAAQGTGLVIIGATSERILTAHTLEPPFSDDMILAAVTGAVSHRPAIPPEDHT